MTTWIISDTHFGDASLVVAPPAAGKVGRPFETVSQMDECLADLWNDHIAEGDRVLHLGDVHAGDGWRVLPRLRGQKHLILGNHDNPLDDRLRAAFATISLWDVTAAAKLALTHLPLDLSLRSGMADRFTLNIHGHLHTRPAPTDRHLCVSVEQTGYKPVNLEELLAQRSASADDPERRD